MTNLGIWHRSETIQTSLQLDNYLRFRCNQYIHHSKWHWRGNVEIYGLVDAYTDHVVRYLSGYKLTVADPRAFPKDKTFMSFSEMRKIGLVLPPKGDPKSTPH